MHLKKEITPTMEGYLEAVLMLEEKKERPRIKAISAMMNVSKPTAHAAIKSLKEEGYLRHESYGQIELTPAGKIIAEDVYRRHKTLTKFLTSILKVDPGLAEKEACGMEHAISNKTLKKFTKFIRFLEAGSQGEAADCLSRFHEYSGNGHLPKCTQCNQK